MSPLLRRRDLALRRITAVLFDFDGTLTKPGELDFGRIRRAIGCPEEVSVLTFIEAIADIEHRNRAEDALRRFEREAAEASVPNEGAVELLGSLKSMGVQFGIQTRNTYESVRIGLRKFDGVRPQDFAVIVARDGEIPPKPDPSGIRHAARAMGVQPQEVLVVGDYVYEIEAAAAAGCVSAILSGPLRALRDRHSTLERALSLAAYDIERLCDVMPIVRDHRPLPMGKVPNELLAGMIGERSAPALLVGPAPGEDVAVVHPEEGHLLALKSDPITFSTDRPGYYAVTVNANDIATAGARPAWMVATLLFPPKTVPAAVRTVIRDIGEVARRSGLVLAGGHSEITDAVNRCVISAAVVGFVHPERLLRKSDARSGDRIVMTKWAGVEGTAILASESWERLRSAGVSADLLDRARAFAERLSIVEEAGIAADTAGTRCMHDVTEGGVATALEEISLATGRKLTVDLDAVPVHECTEAICRALSVDALGLIGSGSVLICVAEEAVSKLINAIRSAGTHAAEIGFLTDRLDGQGPQVSANRGGQPVAFPHFDADELARFLESGSDAGKSGSS